MLSNLKTPSLGSTGSKRSSYGRSFDVPDDSRDYGAGGAMLPVFLNDLRRNTEQDLVEVTLELDDNSIVLYSVTPASTNGPGGGGGGEENELFSPPQLPQPANAHGFLARSSSAASKLRRKFSWFRSPTSSLASSSDVGDQSTRIPMTMDKREEMKMKAKLMRTKSIAQRALGGLRFISKTTKDSDANELWRTVEARFNSLARDGLLSREDFGECIGTKISTKVQLFMHEVQSFFSFFRLLFKRPKKY